MRDLKHLKTKIAESGGFEPPVQFNPYDSLANCWFQPLTQLSEYFKAWYTSVKLTVCQPS